MSNFYSNIASNETNVNNVVAKVALGEADAGIVYALDVPTSYKSMVTVYTIPRWDMVMWAIPRRLTNWPRIP